MLLLTEQNFSSNRSLSQWRNGENWEQDWIIRIDARSTRKVWYQRDTRPSWISLSPCPFHMCSFVSLLHPVSVSYCNYYYFYFIICISKCILSQKRHFSPFLSQGLYCKIQRRAKSGDSFLLCSVHFFGRCRSGEFTQESTEIEFLMHPY